jgi:hypothetical protein
MSDNQGGTAAKRSVADQAVDKYVTQNKRRETAETQTEEKSSTSHFANIKENSFYKILMEEQGSPKEKAAKYEKALAYDEEKSEAENQAVEQAHQEFKEWLQAYRKDMAKELIRLSDTDAFAELQQVLDEMNSSLLDFEELIGPLVETIDAIHTLNNASDNTMYEVFKEIEEDKAEEERVAKLREEQEATLTGYENDIESLQSDVTELQKKKKFFFFGGPPADALIEIADKESEMAEKRADIADLAQEIENTTVERDSKFGHLKMEKEQLRKMLDMGSEEHRDRQKALVQAAYNFVTTTDEKTRSVLDNMMGIKEQIDSVDHVNGQMTKAFTIIKEAEAGAIESDKTLSEKFAEAVADETDLEKLQREETLRGINDHIDVLNHSRVSTLKTCGKLSEESMTIKSMKDTNRLQIGHTREMNSDGTASVASRLVSTLTAFSSAALNEAKSTAQNTMKNMDELTRKTLHTEVIQAAVGLHVQNDEMSKLIEKLGEDKQVSDKAILVAREALQEQMKLKDEIEQATKALAATVDEGKGLASDVLRGEVPESTSVANDEPVVRRSNDNDKPEFKI